MLIKDGKNHDPIITPAPIQPKSASPNAPLIECRTFPDGTDGRRVPEPEEMAEMLNNPRFRAAIDTVERVYGCETMIKRMVRTQFKRDRVAELGVRTQVRAIREGARKAAMKKAGVF